MAFTAPVIAFDPTLDSTYYNYFSDVEESDPSMLKVALPVISGFVIPGFPITAVGGEPAGSGVTGPFWG